MIGLVRFCQTLCHTSGECVASSGRALLSLGISKLPRTQVARVPWGHSSSLWPRQASTLAPQCPCAAPRTRDRLAYGSRPHRRIRTIAHERSTKRAGGTCVIVLPAPRPHIRLMQPGRDLLCQAPCPLQRQESPGTNRRPTRLASSLMDRELGADDTQSLPQAHEPHPPPSCQAPTAAPAPQVFPKSITRRAQLRPALPFIPSSLHPFIPHLALCLRVPVLRICVLRIFFTPAPSPPSQSPRPENAGSCPAASAARARAAAASHARPRCCS